MMKTELGQTKDKQFLTCIRGKFVIQALLVALALITFLFTDFLAFNYNIRKAPLTNEMHPES